jgi:DNA-binding HxlR family transcriptional regulator
VNQIDKLVALCHHRWAIPVMAELSRLHGEAKFVQLTFRLGISPDSLKHTLRALTGQGRVRRNPGYGHPMRPEYLLTVAGQRLAPACDRLMRSAERLGLGDVVLRKWTLPTLFVLIVSQGGLRFSEMREQISPITPRALAQSLKEMEHAGLIDRDVADTYPPSVTYRVARLGRRMAPSLGRLVAGLLLKGKRCNAGTQVGRSIIAEADSIDREAPHKTRPFLDHKSGHRTPFQVRRY